MASDRLVPTSATPGAVTGDDYMDAVAEEVTELFDNSVLALSNIGGTADAITADVVPDLTGGLVAGMNFWLTPTANNTGAVTLSISGEAAVDVVTDDGTALAADQLVSGQTYLLHFDGTDIRVYGLSGTTIVSDYQAFTSSGTWNKPAGIDANAFVLIEAWGAGGGGSTSSNSGGGGGSYVRRFMRASDLGATETVTIGAGGATGTAGGNTSFGSHVTAYGGGGGAAANTGGGGGGGQTGAGASGSGTTGGAGGSPNVAGFGGGAGGTSGAGSPSGFGGAGGGGGTNQNGGASVWGGGGGASSGSGVGGASLFGGAGGNPSVAGTAPGGGGGRVAAGARGEVRVRVVG